MTVFYFFKSPIVKYINFREKYNKYFAHWLKKLVPLQK